MASGSEIAAGAAGAAPMIPALFGRGMNKRTATGFFGQPGHDPNAAYFGGSPTGLRDYRDELARRRAAIEGRQAFTGDFSPAHGQRQNALEAREGQRTVAEMTLARARGQVPSIAQQQADRQIRQAVSSQGAIAASARGRAGLAGAGRLAANNTANIQSGISNQAQINAAQERERAEQAAYGAYTGMRQGDIGSQQVDADEAKFRAQQEQANRDANDRRAFGQEQLEGQAMGQELNARTANQATHAGANTAAEVANQQTGNQNAQSKGILHTLDDFFSDRRAKYVLSDFTTKMPSLMPGGGMEGGLARMRHVSGGNWETGGMGGTSPAMSGPAAESFAGQQGMLTGSPMGELKAHSDFATKFAGDPSGGMAGGFLSDEKVKEAAFAEGVRFAEQAAATEKADIAEHGPEYGKQVEAAKKRVAEKPNRFEPIKDAPRQMQSFSRERPVPAEVSPVDRDYAAAIARQRAIFAAQPMQASVTSDFRSKKPLMGLSRGGEMGTATEGDPNAPRMQFSASTGWYLPNGDDGDRQAASDAFDDETRATTGEDIRRTETSRLAAQGNAMDPEAQWKARFGDNALEMSKTQARMRDSQATSDSNALEARKIRAGFEKDNAQAPSVMSALSAGSKGLYEAQFGSDFTTKETAELGEIQRMRSPKSFKRDTPADQARVKKAFFDKAGTDADAMLAGYKRSLNEGASVGPVDELDGPSQSPVAEANRTMEGQPYVYKPQFTPPDQKPGEPNFGFMAQNLEKSPITATAVKEDPSGLKRVDALKLLRILGASVADLQKQEDETRLALAKGGRKKAA